MIWILFFLVVGINTASSKILAKKPQCSEFIEIKKTDSLWELAKKYYGCGNRWHRFKKYNIFTNPNLIYPGEKLAIKLKDTLCLRGELEKRIKKLEEEKAKLVEKLEELRLEYERLKMEKDIKDKELAEKFIYIKMLEEKITKLEANIEELNMAYKELEDKFSSQRDALRLAEDKLAELYQAHENMRKIAYMLGFTIISGIFAMGVLKE